MILITRPRTSSLEFQKKLKKLKINSEIQELSKFRILKKQVKLSRCILLITSPRSIDYLVKNKIVESCKENKFIVIGKKSTQRLKQLGCKKILISAKDSNELLKKSKLKLNEKSDVRFLCSNVYNKELVKALKKMVFKISVIKVYETTKVKKLKKSIIVNLKSDKFSAIVFFSKFSIKAFFELCRLEKVSRSCLKKIHYICVSHRVGEFAEKRGYNVQFSAYPSEQSVLSLIKNLKLE